MQPISRREFGGLALAVGAARNLFGAPADIGAVLREGVQRHKIPAATAVVANGKTITYTGAFGMRDAASGIAAAPDSIFSIASMTKAVTSAAAMQLVEQGKMTLDEPASKHLPELGPVQVLDGFDASGKPILRRAKKSVTLRQL